MSDMNARRLLAVLAGMAIVAAAVVGCSETITGTPQADPAFAGEPLSPDSTTTRSMPTRSSSPTLTSTAPPTRTTGPGGVAPAGDDTTCRAYTAMNDADKHAVLNELGKDNPMIRQNPELWIGVADMMCSIAAPTALVKDVLMGKI
jgi:hypothetical protein